jgi:hypothetical protein
MMAAMAPADRESQKTWNPIDLYSGSQQAAEPGALSFSGPGAPCLKTSQGG